MLIFQVEEGAYGPELRLARGHIRFVEPVDANGTGIVGLDLAMADLNVALGEAKKLGLPVTGNAVDICGTRFFLGAA
ncbi:hypothetical protein [Parvibaculum sp.]|jgi:hypothetical protein|uniref:hypothetical protein n=1 Tax=Parvibaculum sp. TaxID=2024848 RepID=UPI000C59DF4C|nr:hypothetical protein [Parvibaculum sp.]MAM96114.1 hypothetical protein [Parvibaculum sp.]HCX68612.1 hypothetical protein [Rhodobiaceae bacterium]|tara:strand:- start:12828 stop:13058 length:231 start_codon:yes stop_codon:yes gene_type:complete